MDLFALMRFKADSNGPDISTLPLLPLGRWAMVIGDVVEFINTPLPSMLTGCRGVREGLFG